jgi:hypothetical protein
MNQRHFANRGQVVQLPKRLLPGSALNSMAKYRMSGLVRPGDTLYIRIAERLIDRELAKR